jgi:hypothetical protein
LPHCGAFLLFTSGRRAGRRVLRGHQRHRQRRKDDGRPLDDGQGRRVDGAGPGDTVWIRGGTYNGAVNFTRSGNSGAWITFRAYQGELPIFQGTTGSGISSSSAQDVKFMQLRPRR